MICLYCKKEAEWIDNKEVYGKRFGKSYMCYYCKDCDAYVGCHNNTKKALGTMANKELREWRMKVHAILDPLWKSGKQTRGQVYQFLQDAFGEPIHIGESDIERCKEIIKTLSPTKE
jgi:hypothetical protein